MSACIQTKKSPKKDWHPAEVIAALRMADWTLRQLSIHNGYAPTTLKVALHRPWPKAERIICKAIRKGEKHPKIQPADIWPSRYQDKNAVGNCTVRKNDRNVNSRGNN